MRGVSLSVSGARCFGTKKLHTPDTQQRQNSNSQNNDSHPTEPVGEAAPEEHGVWDRVFNLCENGCSGCRENLPWIQNNRRKTLPKVSVRRCRNTPCQQIRQRAKKRDRYPSRSDDSKAFTYAEFLLSCSEAESKNQTDNQSNYQ